MDNKNNKPRGPSGKNTQVAERSKAKRDQQKKRDASISAPLAISKNLQTSVPIVSGSPYTGDGRCRVKHREYIADVNGSVAFQLTSYAINPGMNPPFSWLPQVAANYESYLLKSLKVYFETQKSASTNGSVMLAVDFDAADPAPTNKTQLMSFHNAVRSAVWNECCYTASLQDLQKFGVQRYNRFGALSANLDIKSYDVGTLYIATQGCADATSVGELYIEYDVEFHTPQVSQLSAAGSAKLIGNQSISNAAYLGTAPTISGLLPVTATGNTITFGRVGEFLVVVNMLGTGFSSNTAPTTGTAQATNTLFGGALCLNGTTELVIVYRVRVNNPGETFIVSPAVYSTTVTSSTVRISSFTFDLQ